MRSKTLRGSFDNFEDRKAAHVLSAFASGLARTLAHLDCGEKSNEIDLRAFRRPEPGFQLGDGRLQGQVRASLESTHTKQRGAYFVLERRRVTVLYHADLISGKIRRSRFRCTQANAEQSLVK